MDKNILKSPSIAYGDASFGSCYRSMKSITGVIVYCYGCPVLWKSTPQSLTASSTMESEWVAQSTLIELETGPRLALEFLTGKSVDEGPLLCDNRSAVLAGRRGPDASNELTRTTRHIALRHRKVLENSKRLFFVPTDEQRADGLTKSSNVRALRIIYEPDFTKVLSKYESNMDMDAMYVEFY